MSDEREGYHPPPDDYGGDMSFPNGLDVECVCGHQRSEHRDSLRSAKVYDGPCTRRDCHCEAFDLGFDPDEAQPQPWEAK